MTQQAYKATSSEVASGTHRLAAAGPAHEAASALMALLDAAPRRTVTVQWMPDDEGQGCRFEIIEVKTGDYRGIAYIDDEGRVTFNGA